MKNSAVSVKNLNVWYEKDHVLRNINLDIPHGKITSLIGASGSGKSTFLRSLNRILEVNPVARVEGQVKVGEIDCYDSKTDLIDLRRKVGMVFQSPTPFPKSIYDNVAYGLNIKGLYRQSNEPWYKKIFNGKLKGEDVLDSHDVLDQIVANSLIETALWSEVKDRLSASALKLSGGQQQRLCIARAVAVKPDVLLLDEPCSALDPISTQKIEELLLKLREKYTIVIVTHNLNQAKRISDHVGFFHLGQLIEFGDAKQIFSKPKQDLTKEYVRGHFG